MTHFWILFILPAIAFAADQRTTVNFPSNAGPSQQQSPNGGQSMNAGVSVPESFFRNPASTLPERQSMNGGGQQNIVVEAYPNPNMNIGYYQSRNPVVAGAFGPPEPVQPGVVFPQGPAEVPNFYFNAGFNKGLGFRVPDTLTGANYLGMGQHTPLGDLWATKADLLPAIFKTGFFITAIVVILKMIAFLVHAKHNFLLNGPLAVDPSPVPIVSILADRSSSKSDEKTREKREASASPVVDPQTDFDQILAQLESIRSIFGQHN